MKHILNNISQEEKQRILEQHSGGKFVDTSNFRRLMESKLGDVKPLIMEQDTPPAPPAPTTVTAQQTNPTQPAGPGDPSQSTVDLSTDFQTLKSALATYNSTVQSIMGVNPGLFIRTANTKRSELLITSNTRQDDSGQPGGDNYVLKYDIPSGTLKRRVGTTPPSFYTLELDGNTIGTGPKKGIWFFGLTADLMKKEKKAEQVKAAANTVGAAIATFFSKIKNSVPKNYVVTKEAGYADGTSDFVFGPATT